MKLANAAILLAGLDPQPAALTIHLLAQLPSPTKPPGQAPNAKPVAAEDSPAAATATPSPPLTAPPEATATAAPAEQLSLLDDASNTDAPIAAPQEAAPLAEAPAATLSGPEPLAIRLRAPMRLNPAVRNALAEIVATLNDSAASSDVCTLAEGIFVPLADFERRGIQPSIAIRALDDTRMIRRPQPGGPPTVSRRIRDATVAGVILAPAHVEGLDPKAFAPAAEGEVIASSDSAATLHRGR